MSMYYIASRRLKLGTLQTILKDERVPKDIPRHICEKYCRLNFMKRVYDTVEEEEADEGVDTKILEAQEFIDDYKFGKELGGKKGYGIKSLAKKHKITQYKATTILRKVGLI